MIDQFLRTFNTLELLRFIVAGCCSVLTDCFVYWLLVQFEVEVSISKLVSFVIGSFIGFVINKLWTFESKGQLRSEIFKYVLLYTTTIILNVLSNKVVLDLTQMWWFAFLFATAVSTVANFLGLKFFVFRKRSTV